MAHTGRYELLCRSSLRCTTAIMVDTATADETLRNVVKTATAFARPSSVMLTTSVVVTCWTTTAPLADKNCRQRHTLA